MTADGGWVSAEALLPETRWDEAEQTHGEGTVRYETFGSEAYDGLNWAILDTDNYYMYWLVGEADEDTEFTLPAGHYAMVMTEMQTETEGTLHYNRFTLEDGETVTLALPGRK